MRMATERSNNTDFDHACLNPHFYLRPSHVYMHVYMHIQCTYITYLSGLISTLSLHVAEFELEVLVNYCCHFINQQ